MDAAVSLLTNAAACPDAVLLSDHKVVLLLQFKKKINSTGNDVQTQSFFFRSMFQVISTLSELLAYLIKLDFTCLPPPPRCSPNYLKHLKRQF